ncbi:MAG TPA: serine hydrolase domain-containing protein [Vicinamibacterales bacterium]|nr:serine hydrolase domain-containing protein [Vicinamibacterales bacterium]
MLAVILRMLAPVTVILFTCSAVAALQEQRGTDPSMDLARFVNGERLAQQLPGLAAVIVRSDGPPRVYVSGERRIGKRDLITPADRMHLGSLTKAITATLIGALAEKQLMTLETTIGQTFPELSAKIQPAYRDVSVRQLLAHAAGIPPYRTTLSLRWLLTLKGTPSEQRYTFVERVLTEPPRFEPGTRHEYSNAGAAIAGAMAERIGGSPYRELVQQLIFARLGGHAAFGNPGLAAEPQPWGHIRTIAGTVTEVTPAHAVYTTPLAIEPAGDASPSMQDYGRFLQLHLRGLRGRDDVLKATTIQDLHRRVALGWTVLPRDGVESHEHVGSYGAYVAYATIQPSRDIAVGVFTNIGGGQGLRDAVARVALRIATRWPQTGNQTDPTQNAARVQQKSGSPRTPAADRHDHHVEFTLTPSRTCATFGRANQRGGGRHAPGNRLAGRRI